MTNAARSRALGMLQAGLSTRNVAATFGVAQSTISRLLQRFNATNTVSDRPRSGRPRSTTRRQDIFVRTSCLRNRRMSARGLQCELRRATGVNISDQTIRNRLRDVNIRSRRQAVRIPLTPRHRRLRLAWCRQHLRWNRHEWSRVLFTDESRFNLHFNDGRIRVYRRRGERFHDVNVREIDRYGGGSVMVWGGIAAGQRTALQFIDGRLTSQRYVDEILRPVVTPFLQRMGPNSILQDDNALPHRGRIAQNYIQRNGINRIDCSLSEIPSDRRTSPVKI